MNVEFFADIIHNIWCEWANQVIYSFDSDTLQTLRRTCLQDRCSTYKNLPEHRKEYNRKFARMMISRINKYKEKYEKTKSEDTVIFDNIAEAIINNVATEMIAEAHRENRILKHELNRLKQKLYKRNHYEKYRLKDTSEKVE